MRLDKYLKVSRIIKRRTVANEACSGGRVTLNGKVAKPGAEVKVGDEMTIRFGDKYGRYEILAVAETVRKEGAADMYRVLSEDEGVSAREKLIARKEKPVCGTPLSWQAAPEAAWARASTRCFCPLAANRCSAARCARFSH